MGRTYPSTSATRLGDLCTCNCECSSFPRRRFRIVVRSKLKCRSIDPMERSESALRIASKQAKLPPQRFELQRTSFGESINHSTLSKVLLSRLTRREVCSESNRLHRTVAKVELAISKASLFSDERVRNRTDVVLVDLTTRVAFSREADDLVESGEVGL